MSKKFIHSLIIPLSTATVFAPIHAEVVLDGSLGHSGTLAGPNYAIGAEVGQQHGSNLFHSFRDFNVQSQESATFAGPDSVRNVISRVTGGRSSTIEGTLRSTIPNADVYLINPAGVVLGPNASLDVQGSFHTSTANTLHLQDGGEFNASQPEKSVLTTAPPAAFGFLPNNTATISVEGSHLSVPAGKTLSLVASEIHTNQSKITAPAGRVNLAGVQGGGQVSTDLSTISGRPGNIILNRTIVNTDGENGGAIYIRAGRLELHKSAIETNTLGAEDATGIDIQAEELVGTEGGHISSRTLGSGKGGVVKIKVKGTADFGGDCQCSDSGVFSSSGNEDTLATGEGGDVKFEAGELILREGAWIGVEAYGSGKSGDLMLWVNAGSVQLLDGAQLYTGTHSTGQGGTLHLKVAQRMNVVGENQEGVSSGIFSYSWSDQDPSGNAGDIVLEAKELVLKDGTQISSVTLGAGQGGNIQLKVGGAVTLSGSGNQGQGSAIISNTEGIVDHAGNGGKVTLEAGQLRLTEGGQIGPATLGPGQGGQIDLKIAGSTSLSGQDLRGVTSTISASAVNTQTDNLGNAGDVAINTETLSVKDGAMVSASATGNGAGGNVKLQAIQIRLSNQGQITAYSTGQGQAGHVFLKVDKTLQLEDSFIATLAQTADGGNIDITVPSYLYLIHSEISSSVMAANGNGGNITIAPGFLVLDNSHIIAQAECGNGGNIDITTQGVYQFRPSTIDASSQAGINGRVTVHSTEVDIEKDLLLPGKLVKLSDQFLPCGKQYNEKGERIGLVFYVYRLAGTPPTPDDLKPSPSLKVGRKGNE